MTIIYGYRHYFESWIFFEIVLPQLLYVVFMIISNLFFIIASKNKKNELKRKELLFRLGIINIVFLIIPLLLPGWEGIASTSLEALVWSFYIVFRGLVKSVPFFYTYGFLILKFWKSNKDGLKSWIKISGIIWIFTFGINTLTLNSSLNTILTYGSFLPNIITLYFQSLAILLALIDLIGWIFILIYSIEKRDKFVLLASIAKFIAYGIVFYFGHIAIPYYLIL